MCTHDTHHTSHVCHDRFSVRREINLTAAKAVLRGVCLTACPLRYRVGLCQKQIETLSQTKNERKKTKRKNTEKQGDISDMMLTWRHL